MHHSKVDLSSLQIHALETLRGEKIVTMTVLANELRMPKTQTTRIVDKLVSRKLVQREYDSTDRRIIKVSLTEAGLELLNFVVNDAIEILADKLKSLDEKDLSVLSSTATRMIEVVKALPL
ncbi:Hypothetical protein LUCI_3038 [Lucifera butyrica]|uniref:HTH marR-type domain-containing protein n=2 Tax=Lucifera butyrica TaxID=1351585 RepID=A0A498RCE9_9FIRM|nr:Hypothetical protein LUCI_3038 [Lucifera butyrica]